MHRFKKTALLLAVAAVIVLALQVEPTTASFEGASQSTGIQSERSNPLERLQLHQPVLPPFAHSVFCLHNPKECEAKRIAMRHGRISLNEKRRAELNAVNRDINHRIIPQQKSTNVIEANWTISPAHGDCNDFAITKRYELEARGWPTSALLLAEVITSWGEHHLVLVVSTRQGDFVLDNLDSVVRRWSETPYRWVRMQSSKNPKLWWTVRTTFS